VLNLIYSIDKMSAWVGKAFAWCIMIMTIGITYEIFVRKLFRAPTPWAFDMSYIMYGALFMMAGAYALSRDSHVRADIFYRLWKPRFQASLEILLYFLFFFPGILAFMFAGWKYGMYSYSFRETSINSPADVPIFQLKMIIPAAGLFLLFQGVAQVMRCIYCLKNGHWPALLHDVEETETMLMHAQEDKAATVSGFEAENKK
jgi:TRAP-type mannitol/chloroaromatic compound transport system permease small subunit